MAEKLTYSQRIADSWRVEYKITEDGGAMSVIAGAGWAKHELTEPKDLDALHKAFHRAERAAAALDGVATGALGWGGEDEEPALTAKELVTLRGLAAGAELSDTAVNGAPYFYRLYRFGWIELASRPAPLPSIPSRHVHYYTISDAGRAALARQEE